MRNPATTFYEFHIKEVEIIQLTPKKVKVNDRSLADLIGLKNHLYSNVLGQMLSLLVYKFWDA